MQEFGKFPKKSESPHHARLYGFGPFYLNPLKRIVLRDGEPLPLTPKCFDILLAFVEHAGEVLVKEELMQSIWPDTVVEEGNLNRNISTLRKVLGESPNDHRYIVTVPGRGYRFVAQVREMLEEKPIVSRHETRGSSAVEPLELPQESIARKALVQPIPIPSPAIVRPRASQGIGGFWPRLFWLALIFVAVAGSLLIYFKFGFRAKPVLTANDQILITDFSNSTGDAVFDDTLKQAVSVQLAQSPFLNVLSDASVHATLKLMTMPPDTRLTPGVARDLCLRAGAKVYIAGSLAKLGSQFVIGLNAVDCRTGDTLAQQQVTAKNKEDVLRALDEVSVKIRKKLGESLSTLQAYDVPLYQATTPSLEALQAFTQGNLARDRKGDAATIPFFRHAIELDPQFALAYDALGLTYSNLDEPGLASENISKAYALRERAGEREKFEIAANYSQIVTGELEKANQTAELWAQVYPRDDYPHNLLGVNFEFLGQYDKAVAEIVEAIRLNPDGVVLYSDLMEDYVALNHLEEAKATYRKALDRKLDHPFLHFDSYAIAFLESDRAQMDREVAWGAGRPGAEDLLLSLESDTSASQGNLRKAREYSRRAVESALREGRKEAAALWRMNEALREVEFGNVQQSLRETRAALSLASTRDVQILAALALARAGDIVPAQTMAKDLADLFPGNTVVNAYWLPSIRASIELDRKNAAKAVEILQSAALYELGYPNPQVGDGRFLYPTYLRGLAYLRLRRGKEAALEFQKFSDHRSVVINCPLGALADLGLARAYLLQGDVAKAHVAYQSLLDHLKNADPDIPIVIQARAESTKLPH
jgi:eukaryotic-like serine/threonine-protein kinase